LNSWSDSHGYLRLKVSAQLEVRLLSGVLRVDKLEVKMVHD
jgi:hypothetical protein